MSEPLIVLDRARFPMIWVQSVAAHVAFLPTTKIQFEYYLCDRPKATYTAEWYAKLQTKNRRVASADLNINNYWGAFITGLTRQDAQNFAKWCGPKEGRYGTPTKAQWDTMYDELQARPASEVNFSENGISPRATSLLQRLSAVSSQLARQRSDPYTLADAMFLHQGVLEWVWDENDDWVATGEPNTDLEPGFFSPKEARPAADPENPPRSFGFRLFRRN